MATESRIEPLVRCHSCSRPFTVYGTSSENGAVTPAVRCHSCNRYTAVTSQPSDLCLNCYDNELTVPTCSTSEEDNRTPALCNCAEVGCFGRRKRQQTKYLIRSHGEMVAAVSNVSHVNVTLLGKISEAEERMRELETKFLQMEKEIVQKEGLCKHNEANAESVKKESAKLKEELLALRKERDEAREENQLLKLSVRELRETSEGAQAELHGVKVALGKTSSCLEETSKSRSILASEKQSLVSKINTIQKELEVALKKKHELSDIVDNHEEYHEKMEAEVKKLTQGMRELTEEKDKIEKDARCNTNFLQRELCKLAERFKRRQRMIERLTADKENLMDSLRQKTLSYDTMHTACPRCSDVMTGVPGTSGLPKAASYDENLNTKILELQIKLDRRDGLVRALEDRIQSHEPDFNVNTDQETFLYRDSPGEDGHPLTSTPVRDIHPTVHVPDKDEMTPDKPNAVVFDDSGFDSVKMKLEELSSSDGGKPPSSES